MPDKKYYKLDDVGRIGMEDNRSQKQIDDQANQFSNYVRQAKGDTKSVSINDVIYRQGSMAKATVVRSGQLQVVRGKTAIKGHVGLKGETGKQGKVTSRNKQR